MYFICRLKVTGIVTVRISLRLCQEYFRISGDCTSGKYIQERGSKLCNYEFIVPSSLNIQTGAFEGKWAS
jgi:hypothetical protein